MELVRGIARCGCCNARLIVCEKSICEKEERYYECLACGKVRHISVMDLDAVVVNYLKALHSESVISQMVDFAKEYYDGNANRMRSARKAAIKVMSRYADTDYIPRDVRSRLRWCVKQLEAITQDGVESARGASLIKEYFSMPMPESCKADPEGMRQAVLWYIECVRVHDTRIEFSSTVDGWLRGKESELYKANLSGFLQEAKPVSADGFEGT